MRKPTLYLSLLVFLVGLLSPVAQGRLIFSNEDSEWTGNSFILDIGNETIATEHINLRFGDDINAGLQYDRVDDLIRINRDLDFLGNEVRNLQFENLSTAGAPTCDGSAIGQVYYDTDQSQLLICDGTSWNPTGSDLLDEDDFVSNSDTQGATQQSIGVYVDNFLVRGLDGYVDGKYVIQKTGSLIDFVRIENESPGGVDLFAVAPDQITFLESPEKTFNSVTLSWNEPTNEGDPIIDYVVQYRVFGDTMWTTFSDGVSTDTTTVVTGLTPDTEYEFQVTATNGSLGMPSAPLLVKTYFNDPFFDGSINVMNVGGATSSVVTALEDNTVVILNGGPLTTLTTRGDTFQFVSGAYDVLEADKPVFVAGNASNSNVVWSLPYWAGEDFAFNAIRSNPQTVRVYAFEAATVEVFKDTTSIAGPVALAAGGSHTFSFSDAGSFHLESTGLIIAYHHSNNYVDPKPLLPGSTDIIGFPSSSMRVTTTVDSTSYTGTHSNSIQTLNSLNRANVISIAPQGTSSLYRSESLRLQANQPITGASYADSNGGAAAPFLPVSSMKTRYAINVASDYVAFASLQPGTVSLIDSTDTLITPALTLTQSGGGANAPYRARFDEVAYGGKLPAGTRIVSTVPIAAWYQPGTNVGAGNDDETILFGYE